MTDRPDTLLFGIPHRWWIERLPEGDHLVYSDHRVAVFLTYQGVGNQARHLVRRLNDMSPEVNLFNKLLATEVEVGVTERRDAPGTWGVEAINQKGDGEIYMAIFSGPLAKDRAHEYAQMKYGLVWSADPSNSRPRNDDVN